MPALCRLLAALLMSTGWAAEVAFPARYDFPPVGSLPDRPNLPDPFLKPDGTRVTTLAEWPQQREYLKALLQHYLYGRVPPRPAPSEVSFIRTSDEPYLPRGSTVAGRKQGYRITIARHAQTHSFSFNLWRPAEEKRYPTLINNHPERSPANPGFSTWRYDPAKYPLLIDWTVPPRG